MFSFFEENPFVLPIIIAVVIILLLVLICWRRVPADKAMVITGLKKRVLDVYY